MQRVKQGEEDSVHPGQKHLVLTCQPGQQWQQQRLLEDDKGKLPVNCFLKFSFKLMRKHFNMPFEWNTKKIYQGLILIQLQMSRF